MCKMNERFLRSAKPSFPGPNPGGTSKICASRESDLHFLCNMLPLGARVPALSQMVYAIIGMASRPPPLTAFGILCYDAHKAAIRSSARCLSSLSFCTGLFVYTVLGDTPTGCVLCALLHGSLPETSWLLSPSNIIDKPTARDSECPPARN